MAKDLLFIRDLDFYEITGCGGDEGKTAASFNTCLGNSWGSAIGNYVRYVFDCQLDLKDPVVVVRYARANAEDVEMSAVLNGKVLPSARGKTHLLRSTGGWGDADSHWQSWVLDRGVKLKKGRNRLVLRHERDFNWITLDAIFVTERARLGEMVALRKEDVEKLAPAERVNFNAKTGVYRNSHIHNGVPLGGVGAGKMEILPDGWWGNIITSSNWDHPIRTSRGTFLAISTKQGGKSVARMLRLKKDYEFDGVENIANVEYQGLFPRAMMRFVDRELPLKVEVEAISPLVAQNLKDSSLPLVQIKARVTNTSDAPADFKLAFSLENLAGKGGFADYSTGSKRTVGIDGVEGNYVKPFQARGLAGVLLKTARTYADARRNALGEYAVAAQRQPGIDIRRYTFNDIPETAQIWAKELKGASDKGIDGKQSFAGVVSAEGTLPAGESREIVFWLAWFMPHHITHEDRKDNGKYYLNFFDSAQAVLEYGVQNGGRLMEETKAWQDLILASSLPFWLKYKIINGTFPAYHNSIFTKDGRFAVAESPLTMGGALGTMDQRMASHGFWAQMLTEADKAEMRLFKRCQQPDGRITHFDGNFHEAIGDPKVGYGITDWPDLSSSWVMQVAKLYRWTADVKFLRDLYPGVKKAMRWMESADRDGDLIPEGGNTYDYEKAPGGMFSYNASCYLGALMAAQEMARVMKDKTFESYCRQRFAAARKSVVKALWNGKYFRKWDDPKAGTRSENSFIASLAGDWLVRLTGLGTQFDPKITKSNLDYLLKRHVEEMKLVPPMEVTPDGKPAVDSSYVHQHEPYLGMEAIYAGFVDRGIEVLKRNFDAAWVNANVGWSMPQNFNCRTNRPYMLNAYMTNTTTWSVFNALAGATLALDDEALYLNPQTLAGKRRLEVPLFFPHFWLWLNWDGKTREANVKAVKVFKAGLKISRIRRLTGDGRLTEKTLRRPFEVAAGQELSVRI